MKYRVCPKCGSNLDHGERCDCIASRSAAAVSGVKVSVSSAVGPSGGDFSRCRSASMFLCMSSKSSGRRSSGLSPVVRQGHQRRAGSLHLRRLHEPGGLRAHAQKHGGRRSVPASAGFPDDHPCDPVAELVGPVFCDCVYCCHGAASLSICTTVKRSSTSCRVM